MRLAHRFGQSRIPARRCVRIAACPDLQRRPHEHLERGDARHGIARQGEQQRLADHAEQQRHAGLHTYFPEIHNTNFGQQPRQEVRLARGHAAGTQDQVRLGRCAPQRCAQRLRIVAHVLLPQQFHAGLAQHGAKAVAVGVVDLAELQRGSRRDDLVAGRQQHCAWRTDHVGMGLAERGERAQARRRQARAGVERRFAACEILPRRAHVRTGRFARRDDHVLVLDAHVFLDDDRIGTARQRRAGRDAQAFAGTDHRVAAVAGEPGADQRENVLARGRQIRAAQREAVHRGIGERGHVDRYADRHGQAATERVFQRDAFVRQRACACPRDHARPGLRDRQQVRHRSRRRVS
jgi:hypothetical protein